MPMGLQAAYGADALQQNLRQRILDQLAAQQRDRAQTQQQFENDLNTKKFDSGEELKRAQLAALVQNQAGQEADRQNAGDIQAANTIPANTELAPTPLSGRLVKMGLGTPNMTLPSTQTTGGIGLPADAQEANAAPISGTLRAIQSPEALRSVTKLASSAQQKTQDEADARVEAARLAAENRTNDNEQKQQDRLAQIAVSAAARPQTDKLTKVEHQDANGKTVIEWLPQSEIKGKTFNKGVTGATETRLASAQAVNQTGNDIIAKLSDPKIAAQVGPAMGRYNSVQDWIGDPPPELSELAGAIESYAIANMGVHGMRSVQGAAEIKKLLDKKHTPESMIQTIKGLSGFSQHFMENEGRTGVAPGMTPKRTRYDINGKVIP